MSKKKILIADDDHAILEALTLMLEDAGYETDTTVDGQTIQEATDQLPDLILLDIWMSGTDGRDICKHLKRRPQTKHIPIIMVSANKDAEHIAKESGADGFIAKPFEMDDLLALIEKYMKNSVTGTP